MGNTTYHVEPVGIFPLVKTAVGVNTDRRMVFGSELPSCTDEADQARKSLFQRAYLYTVICIIGAANMGKSQLLSALFDLPFVSCNGLTTQGLDLGVAFINMDRPSSQDERHVGMILDLEGADGKDQLSDEADSDVYVQSRLALMACLCAHIMVINISYSARVQSHGASLPLLRRLHQGRRQHLDEQARIGMTGSDRIRIVFAIRDWPHENNHDEKVKVIAEIMSDFERQWLASDCQMNETAATSDVHWSAVYDVDVIFLSNAAPDANLFVDSSVPHRAEAKAEFLRKRLIAFQEEARAQFGPILRNNLEERFDRRQIFESKDDSSADDNGSVINLFRKLWEAAKVSQITSMNADSLARQLQSQHLLSTFLEEAKASLSSLSACVTVDELWRESQTALERLRVSWNNRATTVRAKSVSTVPFPDTQIQALIWEKRQEFDRDQQIIRNQVAEYERGLEQARQEQRDRQTQSEREEEARREVLNRLTNDPVEVFYRISIRSILCLQKASPGTDTIWIIFAARQEGRPTQYFCHLYGQIRPQKSGGAYTQWIDHRFRLDRNIKVRFTFMLANLSNGNEALMRALIDLYDQERRVTAAMPALQPEPGVFRQVALGTMNQLPAALGVLVGGALGPLGALVAPAGAFLGQVVHRLANNRNCIVANNGVDLQSPADADPNNNYGSHELYIQEQRHLQQTTQYKVQFEVYRE